MSALRMANTTIAKYFRTVEDATLRSRKLWAMLKSRGGISFNNSGKNMDWKIMYKEAPLQGLIGTDGFTFAEVERWKTAELGWRAFGTADSIKKQERLANTGNEAIVKVLADMSKRLGADMMKAMGQICYLDGNAPGNESLPHGFDSFTSVSGPSAQGFVGTNNDNYAGLDTALFGHGGNWESSGGNPTWPSGRGDAHADFFTPLIVDYTDASWTAATDTWPNTCLEVLGFATTMASHRTASQPDVFFLAADLFRQFKEAQRAKEQLNVMPNMAPGSLQTLGFKDVFNFDGSDVTTDYDVPAACGYGWALDYVEFMSQQATLFDVTGPEERIEDQSLRVTVDCHGNFKFGNERGGIRAFVKLMAIT